MKASYISIGILLLTGIAAGCDNIGEDERYYIVEKPTVDNPKNLLIMEFTGNECKNCPNGASAIEQIKLDEQEGRVISVGLHPEGDINTEPVVSKYTQNGEKQCFWSSPATALYKFYNPSGFPTAIFNGLKSSMSSSINDWQTRASEAIVVPAKMTISALSEYDDATRNLTVSYEVDFSNVVDTKLNISIWIVENKIMGTQRMPNGKLNLDYEHNHVLRGSLNGDWGEPIGSVFDSDSKVTGKASSTLNEKWVAENCDVVVYVYRDDNKEVEQAISIKLKN